MLVNKKVLSYKIMNKLKMVSKKNESWAIKHVFYVEYATKFEQHVHEEARMFDRNELPNYRKWYHMKGMASVYLFGMHVDELAHVVPIPRDEHGKSGYIPSGSLIIRNVNTFNSKIYKLFIRYHFLYSHYVYRYCVGLESWCLCKDNGFGDRARALMDQKRVPDIGKISHPMRVLL